MNSETRDGPHMHAEVNGHRIVMGVTYNGKCSVCDKIHTILFYGFVDGEEYTQWCDRMPGNIARPVLDKINAMINSLDRVARKELKAQYN